MRKKESDDDPYLYRCNKCPRWFPLGLKQTIVDNRLTHVRLANEEDGGNIFFHKNPGDVEEEFKRLNDITCSHIEVLQVGGTTDLIIYENALLIDNDSNLFAEFVKKIKSLGLARCYEKRKSLNMHQL